MTPEFLSMTWVIKLESNNYSIDDDIHVCVDNYNEGKYMNGLDVENKEKCSNW